MSLGSATPALAAALLFGASTPLAKLLLGGTPPLLLAGLLYLGSGIGLGAVLALRRLRPVRVAAPMRIPRADLPWLLGAIVFGGMLGPALLMWGLTRTDAATASLLLNVEGMLTALLAWWVFKENADRRIVLGMLAIVAGGVLLSWEPGASSLSTGALLIVAACLCWAIDNNLTRKVSLADASWIASVKGLAAGSINLALAFGLGATLPRAPVVAASLLVGFLAYGVSLTWFVLGLRHLGTARTGAYFSIAPFFGAVLAVALGEPVTAPLLLAGALMAVGIWLHLTERHSHEHTHEPLAHEHMHVHDAHHRHRHDPPVPPGTRHSHWHQHEALTHTHPHFPDVHHRHKH